MTGQREQDLSADSVTEDRAPLAFILKLGRALHTYGYPAHRLEAILEETTRRLGLEGQFFSTPTSIFIAFGPQDDQRTHLLRVEPGETDLGKLADLDEVTTRVLSGEMSPGEGMRRIDEILLAPPLYGRLLTVLAFALASASASRFLGGGVREIAVSSAIGLMIGALSLIARKFSSFARIFEPAAAFLASAFAVLIAAKVGAHSISNDVLAGLIVLVPGLTLTVAITELSSQHLVAGTSSLTGAFVAFLKLGFGVAVGGKVMASIVGSPRIASPTALPDWTEYIALIAAPVGFTILLRAHKRDVLWIILAGALAVAGSRAGGQALGPELGVFVGSLTVGVASNLYARFLNRPSTVTLVPGILLLVPGSMGFRSIAAMLDQHVVPGVDTAFRMILIAVALVAGILMSKVILPSRRVV
ncbi:MAG: threonine/serine exporter family protein [Acidobacteriota bacterium]